MLSSISCPFLGLQAILLGVIQLLSLTFATWMVVLTTEKYDFSILMILINTFAFCGVSFDALGALFALWTFRSLFLTISRIEKTVLEKQNLSAKIHLTLDTFRKTASSLPGPPGRPQVEALANLFADFQQTSAKRHREARGLVHLIDDHLSVQEDSVALLTIAAGLLFFFISSFFLILSTQPLSVWVSTTMVVLATFLILNTYLGRQRPGLWRSITRKITRLRKIVRPRHRNAPGAP